MPAFEVLDAVHKKVIDGGHTAAAYWVGKQRAATLFGPAPGGPFGMDMIDYMGWIYDGGGLELYRELYQDQLKRDVIPIPMTAVANQVLGWFKRPVASWEDLKGRKCRETGITAEVFSKSGMSPVNMPGGEIVPAGERGVIECGEWVGPAEDMKIGFQTVWKHYYMPSTHEPATVLELLINADVWKGLKPDLQEIIKSATWEATFRSQTIMQQAERRGAEGAAREARRQDRAHAGGHPAGRRWKPGTRSPRKSPRRTRSSRRSTTSQRAYASRGRAGAALRVSRPTRPAPTTTGPRRNDRERSRGRVDRGPFVRRADEGWASCKAQPASEPARQPSRRYLATIRAIDGITQWTGYLFALLVIPLIVANVIEVFMRYVMNAPTSWALDVTTMSFGALFMLGAAYALLKGAHVRTDMLWEKFSDRKKGIIDSVAYLLFFLPSMAILFAISIDDFFYSLSINEKSTSGIWQPVIWPLRAVIPLAAALLFLQGISELMKSLWAARTGEMLVHHEKIEV